MIEAAVLSYGASIWMAPTAHIPMVTVRIEYPYDARTVPDGVPHLTEHLLFESTRHFQNGDVDRWIRQAGGHSTAWTTWNSLVIETSVSSNNLDVLLAIEKDRSTELCVALTEENLDNQRQIIASEMLRQSLVEDGRLADSMRKRAFSEDPILSKEVMGLIYDLELASLSDVCTFTEQWLHPSNARWFVSGDIEPDVLLSKLEEAFKDVSKSAFEVLVQPSPIQRTAKRWHQSDPSNRLFLMWPAPSGRMEAQQVQLVLDALETAQKLGNLPSISRLHPWYESHLNTGWMGVELHTLEPLVAIHQLEQWMAEPSLELLTQALARHQVSTEKQWLTNAGRVHLLHNCVDESMMMGVDFDAHKCDAVLPAEPDIFTATWLDVSDASMLWMGTENTFDGDAW